MLHCCNALCAGETWQSDVQEVPVHSACYHCAQVFAGALSALAVMTVLSAAMGWAAPNLVCTLQFGVQAYSCLFLKQILHSIV